MSADDHAPMSATETMAAEISEPQISEPLTWAEICARHPDEWVCLVEIDQIHPNDFEFRTARVIGHGKTKRAPFDQARLHGDRYKRIGHYFTGPITFKNPRPVVIIDDETREAFRWPPNFADDDGPMSAADDHAPMSATETMAAEISEPQISEPLTWAEICARYPDEWVCLVEIDEIHPNGFEFRTARVIGHGKTARAPFDQARPVLERYDCVGHYFTGPITFKNPRPVVIIDDETRDAFRWPLS